MPSHRLVCNEMQNPQLQTNQEAWPIRNYYVLTNGGLPSGPFLLSNQEATWLDQSRGSIGWPIGRLLSGPLLLKDIDFEISGLSGLTPFFCFWFWGPLAEILDVKVQLIRRQYVLTKLGLPSDHIILLDFNLGWDIGFGKSSLRSNAKSSVTD